MPTFIGMVKFKDQKVDSAALRVGQTARAWTDHNGGRILSIYWAEEFSSDMLITFEGRGVEQATSCFKDVEKQENVTIHMFRALTEGEKERASVGKKWVS